VLYLYRHISIIDLVEEGEKEEEKEYKALRVEPQRFIDLTISLLDHPEHKHWIKTFDYKLMDHIMDQSLLEVIEHCAQLYLSLFFGAVN
jgi:hypothetical protein